MSYLHDYEAQCADLTAEEITEEATLAWKAMRAAQRLLDMATGRWVVASAARNLFCPEDQEAVVIPLPRASSEGLVVEGLDV